MLRFVAKLLAKVPQNPEIETCGEVILTPAELDKAGKFWVKQTGTNGEIRERDKGIEKWKRSQ